MSEKKFVMIDNEFMADSELYSNREQFIYVLLKALENNVNGATVVHIESIARILGLSSHSKNRTAIQNVLLSLEEKNLLLLYTDLLLTNQIAVKDMKLTGVYYAKLVEVKGGQGFTKIYYTDIDKFMYMDEKYKDLMFVVYFNIIQRIFDSESSLNYSYPNIDTIEAETGINRKTVMKYIKVLKEHEILYYEKVRKGEHKDKNYYTRWKDRGSLIQALHSNDDIEDIIEEIA